MRHLAAELRVSLTARLNQLLECSYRSLPPPVHMHTFPPTVPHYSTAVPPAGQWVLRGGANLRQGPHVRHRP